VQLAFSSQLCNMGDSAPNEIDVRSLTTHQVSPDVSVICVNIEVSNTRTPDTLFSVTDSIGCKAGTPAEAASFGEIALVAIPLKNYRSIPLSPLEGKIVIDANNYYTHNDTVA
jgi:predicted dinucleotide-binding enzyme